MKSSNIRTCLRLTAVVTVAFVLHTTVWTFFKFFFIGLFLFVVFPSIFTFIYEIIFDDIDNYDGILEVTTDEEGDHYVFKITRDLDELDTEDRVTLKVIKEDK